jgi:hypothetical protein
VVKCSGYYCKTQSIDNGAYAKGIFLMEPCKGFKNWFECLSCPRLCTTYCPLEGKNVIEEMRRHIHGISVSGAEEKSH